MNQGSSEDTARFIGSIGLVMVLFAFFGPVILIVSIIDPSVMPSEASTLGKIGLWLFILAMTLVCWIATPFLLPYVIHTISEIRQTSDEKRLRRESAIPSMLHTQKQRAGGSESPPDGELTRRLGTVQYMSGSQFEVFVADVLRGLGYRTTVLGGSGDQGVDVIAMAGNERLAIQCKNYVKPVGNKPVQEVYAGSRHHGCTAAWVVAPEGFTKGAVELARSVGVSLHDAQSLRGWIRQIGRAGRDKAERKPANLEPYTVDRAQSETRMENSTGKKHTVKVGVKDSSVGETVSFAADLLGTASVNNGERHYTYYRLPDGTFRVLVEGIGVSMLVPSNMTESLSSGQRNNFSYGSMTLQEMKAHEHDLWLAYEALMKKTY